MNADSIQYLDSDETSRPIPAIGGISVFSGITERGPINDPKDIIYSWGDYKLIFGGLLDTSDFPLICKRALDGGSPLRINRIAHYTDITDAATLTATRPVGKSIFQEGTVSAALSPPTGLVASAQDVGGGGILGAGTYQYVVSTINTNGETLPSVASSGTITAGNDGTVTLTWNAVIGATGYKIYRDGAVYFTSAINSFTDLGAVGTEGVPASSNTTESTGVILATLRPKYAGAIVPSITIADASNGIASYFDVEVYVNGTLTEHFKNLRITGRPTAINSTYLSKLSNSNLIEFIYADLSGIAGTSTIIVEKETINFAAGSNGDLVVAIDYIGDSGAATGFFALDGYDDFYQFAAPEISDDDVHNAGASYADGRQDCEYWAHLSNDSSTVAALVAERGLITVDTKYLSIFGGGIRFNHPISNVEVELSELGDMSAIQAYVDKTFAPWISAANFVRAVIRNTASGVVNNLGSRGDFNKLNELVQNQINMMVQANNRIYMSSNVSGQLEDTKASYRNVVRGIIYIKKAIYPILIKYLQEPPTFSTFAALFNEVEPIFEDMAARRAFSTTATHKGYRWMGDQDASTYEELVINTKVGLDAGEYKVRVELDFLGSINTIAIEFALVDSTLTTTIIENTL